MDSILVFVSGSSGSGKSSVINGVIDHNPKGCKFLVSNTTRAQRASDKKVGQYHFITKAQFEDKIKAGQMLEYDVYNGNYYGLDKYEIESNVHSGKVLLKDLTVKGVLNSKEVLGDKYRQVNVFITERKKVLKERLIARGEKKDVIKNRLRLYLNEQRMSRHYDYTMINSSLNKSIEFVEAVINTEYNDLPILTNVPTSAINVKRIDKVSKRMREGKLCKPILVSYHEGRIYIVEGVNTYLAALSTGKHVSKQLVNKDVIIDKFINQDEWVNIVGNYTK